MLIDSTKDRSIDMAFLGPIPIYQPFMDR